MATLPVLNRDNLKKYFHRYDWSDDNAGIDDDELHQWMSDVNQLPNDKPTLEDAAFLVKLIDTNNADGMIQYEELAKWMTDESKKTSAARKALSQADGKSCPMPITSPVDRISGPKNGSTPKNLLNGKTDSFTEK